MRCQHGFPRRGGEMTRQGRIHWRSQKLWTYWNGLFKLRLKFHNLAKSRNFWSPKSKIKWR